MSRHEVKHKDRGLAFGTDHACGDFLMIWKRPADSKERMSQDQFGPDPEDMLFDKDTLFHGLTRDEYLAALKEHGFAEAELETAYHSV